MATFSVGDAWLPRRIETQDDLRVEKDEQERELLSSRFRGNRRSFERYWASEEVRLRDRAIAEGSWRDKREAAGFEPLNPERPAKPARELDDDEIFEDLSDDERKLIDEFKRECIEAVRNHDRIKNRVYINNPGAGSFISVLREVVSRCSSGDAMFERVKHPLSILEFLRKYAVSFSIMGAEDLRAKIIEQIMQMGSDQLLAFSRAASINPETSPAKPRAAPRLYAERPDPKKEDIVQFIKSVYGAWLGGTSFTLGDLRVLDPQAAAAVDHLRRQGKWPASVKLPTLPEAHDALLSDPDIEAKVREARRLVRLYDSRKSRPS